MNIDSIFFNTVTLCINTFASFIVTQITFSGLQKLKAAFSFRRQINHNLALEKFLRYRDKLSTVVTLRKAYFLILEIIDKFAREQLNGSSCTFVNGSRNWIHKGYI